MLLEGCTYDVQQHDAFKLELTGNQPGQASFEFDLLAYVAGGGLGRFYLQASVTDLAQHLETSRLSLPISSSGLIVQAVPKGASFRPRLENILYLMASYPDGSPAEADITVLFNYYNPGHQGAVAPQTLEVQ